MTWTEATRERYKDDDRRTPGDLTAAEWQTIEPVLRGQAVLKADLREIRLPRPPPRKIHGRTIK